MTLKTDPTGASRYPLTWPATWPRTMKALRRYATFGTKEPGAMKRSISVSAATDRLADELRRLGAREELLSTNLALRLDGLPRSDQSEPADPGAAVYFALKGQARVLACDRWTRVADNITAIAMHVRAIRAVDRYGVGSLDQAFAGYAALPPEPGQDWAIVLGVAITATADEIEMAFRQRARAAHPDAGGNTSDMARLNIARAAALAARR